MCCVCTPPPRCNAIPILTTFLDDYFHLHVTMAAVLIEKNVVDLDEALALCPENVVVDVDADVMLGQDTQEDDNY